MADSANQRNDRGISEPRRPSSTTPTPSKEKHGRLPEGACNFRDLTAGPKPPGCGCRRFWLGPSLGRIGLSLAQSQEPWCACGHHACFHERKETQTSRDRSLQSSFASKESLSQGHEQVARAHETAPTQPWRNRSTRPATQLDVVLEHHQTAPILAPLPTGQPQIPSFNLTSSELRGYTNYNGSIGLELDFHRGMRKFSESPTVADGVSVLGDIPSTRHASSEDRVSPSNAFMRHIMNARQEAANARQEPPRLDTTSLSKAQIGLGLGDIVQSATEVATPTTANTPQLNGAAQLIQEAAQVVGILEQGVAAAAEEQVRASTASNHSQASNRGNVQPDVEENTCPSTQTIREALQQIPPALQRLAPLLASLQTQVSRNPDISIHESINSLIRRMDTLENASFNQLPPEQVHDQFQHMDVRISDLEARTDEHSRQISALEADSGRSGSYLGAHKTAHASFASHASGKSLESTTSSALIAAAIDRVEAAERLKNVEERLDTLEKLQMPSLAIPWEVEVVLLPWGRDLRGIWCTLSDLHKSAATQDDEDWTQARGGKISSRNSMSVGEGGWNEKTIREWADNDDETVWPKACGVNGIVYHRLRSRGLVRKITLTSPGARDLVTALNKEFGELLETISNPDRADEMDEDSDEDELMGLTAPFLPLRKVHKSSRLRFLTEAELITPALWTAEFLAAGVLMRAAGGQKRLFITTRTGYTQGEANGWTWSALRQLSRVHETDGQRTPTQDVPEADALEPCWKHNAAIDDPSTAHSSFYSNPEDSGYVEAHALTQASRSAESVVRDPTIAGPSSSPNITRQPITPISEFPPTQASQRHRYRKSRTLSTSLSDAALQIQAKTGSLPGPSRPMSQQSKRRIRSFEQSANPALIAALPTFVPSPTRGSMRSTRIKKRRRIARSKSSSSVELATQSTGKIDAQSLHPEADPEQVLRHLRYAIPHGSEIKPLSDFVPRSHDGSRQLSVSADGFNAVAGASRATEKRGITPSAYATPFSGTVAGVDDDYVPSESGEDWAGVDEEQGSSDSDDLEIDDDMTDGESEEESEGAEGPGSHDDLHDYEDEEDEDEEMMSSEDELQMIHAQSCVMERTRTSAMKMRQAS